MAPTCSNCGGPAAEAFTTRDRNRRISDRSFTYLRCTRCGLLWLADPPEDLGAYYAGDYFGFPSAAELRSLPREEQGQVDHLVRHARPGPIVEIGPGRGFFSAGAKAAGFDLEAVDRDERALAQLRDVVGVRVTLSDAPEEVLRARSDLSAVVMWQVIEHLPDPWSVLDAAAAALAPGGVVIVATPNPTSLQARLMRGRWPHVDAPRHLQLIPPSVLLDRAARAGLRPERLLSDDAESRRWSAFGWQRLLANELPGRYPAAAGFLTGTAVGRALWPVESQRLNGASYTAVLRKP